jgi:hypothetical protein
MSLVEMLPIVRSLSRIDKPQLIQLLVDDLAQAEESTPLTAGRNYPIYSPDRVYEAADALLREMEAERTGP